jgi:DNA primase
MLPEPNIALIQSKTDLVKIITAYFPLTESRLVLKGKCPFHGDDMNSFMVSPAKNIFKCFGCGMEGGPIEFIMAIENKKYEEAVKMLALLI